MRLNRTVWARTVLKNSINISIYLKRCPLCKAHVEKRAYCEGNNQTLDGDISWHDGRKASQPEWRVDRCALKQRKPSLQKWARKIKLSRNDFHTQSVSLIRPFLSWNEFSPLIFFFSFSALITGSPPTAHHEAQLYYNLPQDIMHLPKPDQRLRHQHSMQQEQRSNFFPSSAVTKQDPAQLEPVLSPRCSNDHKTGRQPQFSGMNREELVDPIPGRPWRTGLYVMENSPR